MTIYESGGLCRDEGDEMRENSRGAQRRFYVCRVCGVVRASFGAGCLVCGWVELRVALCVVCVRIGEA